MSDDLLVLDNRLIAFLDVLGFASRMDNETAVNVVKEYGKFIADADKTVFNPPNMLSDDVDRVSNFATSKFVFDSIVLVSHPIDDPKNICNFILAIIQLMESGLLNNLPLRGAISLGSYVEDRANGVFVSPEFKRLHFEEQRLQWAGCCVLDNAADTVLKGLHGQVISPEFSQRHHPIVYYPVPVKDKDNSILSFLDGKGDTLSKISTSRLRKLLGLYDISRTSWTSALYKAMKATKNWCLLDKSVIRVSLHDRLFSA